ncbi:hypothetical protein ACWCYY_34925 [Kitasatospora sp. NPDC001664]
MNPSSDLAALRAAAQREIERHADRPLPGTWRLVRLGGLPAIAPACDRPHPGPDAGFGTDTDGLYDCCPHPWVRVGVLSVADLLLVLLNHRPTVPQPEPAAPEAFSDDPTGAWT